MLMLHAANVPYVWDDATANAWPEPKNTQPFGQLPVLVHEGEDRWNGNGWQSFDRRVAQSGTITRYCARLAGLWPKETDKWLKADMLIEHCNDIFTMMAKCKYVGDAAAQRKAWAELAEKKYPEHLAWLEKMLGSDDYFGGDKHDAGDVAVFSVLNLASRAGVACPLKTFPNLFAHSQRVAQLGSIMDYLAADYPLYFSVPAPAPAAEGSCECSANC